MAEQEINREVSEEERLIQLAAQVRAAEYKGLSEEEIQERERQKEMRRKRNVQIMEDTLDILKKGSYEKDGREVNLRFSPEQMREIQVFLPEDIDLLRTGAERNTASALSDFLAGDKDAASSQTENFKNNERQSRDSIYTFSCENIDALALAQRRYQELKENGEPEPRILVLNLASATRPGGRTRDGASAQEEDLCRRTSLLLSLESGEAKKYYDYNNARKTRMGSDGVMISPCVEVLKDASAKILSEPFVVSVMSCAAPMIRMGLEGMLQQEYEEMLYKRIQGMLLVAASQNYRHLILGAFGCGVYCNDAALVSDLFYRAIQESGLSFTSIDFAVLCRPEKDYNFREFCRNFSRQEGFCSDEKSK
ncbi:MAG: TIGR02452 family protein [Lachnospiraceae bacterium]|nr:TIGR02452 family protein [Lachnospiraceae bacterium]